MLLHGKRAALSHFFRHFKPLSTNKNATFLAKQLTTNNLPSKHQLPKCLAYLRKLFPRRKTNERFVRFFHSKIKPQMALYQEQIEAHGEIHSCGKQAKAKDNQQFTEIELTR